MIAAVDRALTEILRRDVLGDAVPVSLDGPNRPWTQTVSKPTVNLFLFDVRENVARREVMVEPVRDASGAVVARRPPPSRYDLFYILSVWGATAEVEHQVLAAAVSSLGIYDVIPPELLGETAPGHGCFLSVAAGMKRGMLPTFGGELKVQVDLAVTVPVLLAATGVAGPPVRHPARIAVEGRTSEEIEEVRRSRARLPVPRRPHDDPFAATREGLARAVAEMPPLPPPPGPPGRPGGPPPGQRPASGPPAPGQRPAQQAPAQRQPARQPSAAAGPPISPLAALRVALAQAAQAQAALAQAVAGLASMLPAPAAPAPAAPAAAAPAGTAKTDASAVSAVPPQTPTAG